MSKIACIYHSIDLDGWMSAAVVKYWFLNEYKNDSYECGNEFQRVENYDSRYAKLAFIGYNYGQPIPDLSEYGKVIMCDISFPKEDMLNLWATKGLNFHWIDHHISAIKDMENAHENISSGAYPIQGLRNTKFAACELTWKYFFPNESVPEIVRLLGRYDCFGHKNTDEEQKVLEFQYGARQCISNYEEAYTWLLRDLGIIQMLSAWSAIDVIHDKGRSIYSYLCTEAKQSYKNGFNMYFRYSPEVPEHRELGFTEDVFYKFICINKERFNPINFGIDYHKDGYDGVACFHYADGMWNFSVYNDNGLVDCSVIAKQYGGGGHKGAAGFRLNNEQFLELTH